MKKVSIILCTRNRAQSLRDTLAAIARCDVPQDLEVELLVVDNGSSDPTKEVIEGFRPSHLRVRCEHEPRRGKGHAYNTAIKLTDGEVLLCTDDDCHPSINWIEQMTRPILEGKADATTGEIHIAPHLLRPWMTDAHRGQLMEIRDLSAQHAREPFMIGANMAFSRRVLEAVPGFEVCLGAGALGNMEDTLFYLQLIQAGYRIAFVAGAPMEHHFDPDRLTRDAQLRAARGHGISGAWVTHHWSHTATSWRRLRMLKNLARMAWGQAKWICSPRVGFDPSEVQYAVRYWTYRELGRLKNEPRVFERLGLVGKGIVRARSHDASVARVDELPSMPIGTR